MNMQTFFITALAGSRRHHEHPGPGLAHGIDTRVPPWKCESLRPSSDLRNEDCKKSGGDPVSCGQNNS